MDRRAPETHDARRHGDGDSGHFDDFLSVTCLSFLPVFSRLSRPASFCLVGATGPPTENPYDPKQKMELFYPRRILMDLSLTALLIIGLGSQSCNACHGDGGVRKGRGPSPG
jgi:hypothetical protein